MAPEPTWHLQNRRDIINDIKDNWGPSFMRKYTNEDQRPRVQLVKGDKSRGRPGDINAMHWGTGVLRAMHTLSCMETDAGKVKRAFTQAIRHRRSKKKTINRDLRRQDVLLVLSAFLKKMTVNQLIKAKKSGTDHVADGAGERSGTEDGNMSPHARNGGNEETFAHSSSMEPRPPVTATASSESSDTASVVKRENKIAPAMAAPFSEDQLSTSGKPQLLSGPGAKAEPNGQDPVLKGRCLKVHTEGKNDDDRINQKRRELEIAKLELKTKQLEHELQQLEQASRTDGSSGKPIAIN